MSPGRLSPGVLFVVLCLVWGANWLAVKFALFDVPPFAFAAARSALAGVLMVALAGPATVAALVRAAPGRVLLTAILTNTLTYAGLYWGTARISIGLAAIVNNTLMPIGLLAFALAFREEAFSRRRLAGILFGAAGVALLFARRSDGGVELAGVAAVVGGTLAYCLGSVWSRPLLRQAEPMAVGGAQMIGGAIALVPVSAALESPSPQDLAALLAPVPLAALAWLAVAGGVAGMTIYLRLIRDWGPSRAGMYAFVSPVVAALLGAAVLGERLGLLEALGGAIMLAAAALVIPAPPSKAAGAVANH